jgi:hypothetical protein
MVKALYQPHPLKRSTHPAGESFVSGLVRPDRYRNPLH